MRDWLVRHKYYYDYDHYQNSLLTRCAHDEDPKISYKTLSNMFKDKRIQKPLEAN